jgi:hypothetical protein
MYSIQRPSKIYYIHWYFWFENIPSGNPVLYSLTKRRTVVKADILKTVIHSEELETLRKRFTRQMYLPTYIHTLSSLYSL